MRFNSVPRLKIATSLQIDLQNKNSPLALQTPRRMITESVHKQNFSKFDQWKPERLIKYLRHKIMDRGINQKIGLQEIYIIHNFRVFKYFVPKYAKIDNENELITDFIEQQMHLKQLLMLRTLPKLWTIDGNLIKNFHQLKSKMVYINSSFDFWEMITTFNNYEGKFYYNDKLLSDVQGLQSEQEVSDYFFSPSQLQQYFKQSVILNKLPQISQKKIELEDHEIDTAFSLLNSDKQKAKVQIFEQLNREYISKSNHTQKSRKLVRFPIKQKSRHSIEQQIIQGNITDPFELQQQVQEQIEGQIQLMTSPEISISEVCNPFQLKKKVNEPSFIKNVNIDKIQMDYKITRRQTINFLTIFKCLLDRETQPHKFSISKANLLLAYPYLLMEGQTYGYETFSFLKETKLKKFTFEEFVKIFTQGNI